MKIEVGKEFPLTKINNGLMFDFREDTGFVLFVGLANVDEKEVELFKKGTLNLSLSYVDEIIFLLLEMRGFIENSDAPFHIGLSKEPLESFKLDKNETSYGLSIYLVDIIDNTLKAIRVVGLGENFSDILYQMVEHQSREKLDIDKYNMKLHNIFMSMTPVDIQKLSKANYTTKKELK